MESAWPRRFFATVTFVHVRVMDSLAAAVAPNQVELVIDRTPLWVRIPENDGKCPFWHNRAPFELSCSEPHHLCMWCGCSTAN